MSRGRGWTRRLQMHRGRGWRRRLLLHRRGGGAAVYYCVEEGVVPSSDAVPGRAVAPPSTASSGMEMQTAPQPWLPNASRVPPPSSMVWGRTGGPRIYFIEPTTRVKQELNGVTVPRSVKLGQHSQRDFNGKGGNGLCFNSKATSSCLYSRWPCYKNK
jgi:hypothetical protein